MAYSFDLAVSSNRERRSKVKRRRKEVTCKSLEPTREIPFDLVIEILTRLPAKSVMRFKSVSKLWSSLISSQYFTSRFIKVSPSPPRLYMMLEVDNIHAFLSSSASPSPTPDSDGTTKASFVVDHELKFPTVKGGYSFSHVFHCLMCFIKGPSVQIYNTSTRQLVVLPDIEESSIIPKDDKSNKIMCQIGHDPIHDQYKVLCTATRCYNGEVTTFESEHWVLLLGGGDGSSRWRKIPSRCPPHLPITQGVTINGRTHYLAWLHVHLPCRVIVTFDIHSEEISILVQVPHFPSMSFYETGLIEYGGRLALLHHWDLKDKGVMKLWVMEDEEKKRWSRKSLRLRPSQKNMLNSKGFLVLGKTREGDVIFVPDNTTFDARTLKTTFHPQKTTSFYVFLYNLQKNHMRKVEIIESSNRYRTKNWTVFGFDDTDNLLRL